eukprot:3863868-Prymnesium_polylepis.1
MPSGYQARRLHDSRHFRWHSSNPRFASSTSGQSSRRKLNHSRDATFLPRNRGEPHEGPNGNFGTYVARFGYRHNAVEASMYTTAYYLTDVKGEMFLRQGYAYWLTATHLCYSEAPNTQASFGMVEASVNSQGYLVAERDALLASDDTRTAPAASSEYTDLCLNANSSSV